MILETPRTRLRELTPADAPWIQVLVTQPSWLRNIGDRGVHDLASAEGYIRNGPMASYARHGFGLWAVERKADGTPLGICGLLQRDYLDAPDLGYAFLEAHQGQGYASEVTEATVRHARAVLGTGTIDAIVDPENAPSIRVLEKLGMHLVGPITVPGSETPIAHYRLA